MIKNVYNALRKFFSCEEGDYIGSTPLSSENASENLTKTYQGDKNASN